jgi:hypothetical protein
MRVDHGSGERTDRDTLARSGGECKRRDKQKNED